MKLTQKPILLPGLRQLGLASFTGLAQIGEWASLVPRPLPDYISQPWRKIDFSPWLRDIIWEWPGDEARKGPVTLAKIPVCAVSAVFVWSRGKGLVLIGPGISGGDIDHISELPFESP